jgi:hypothetical protein
LTVLVGDATSTFRVEADVSWDGAGVGLSYGSSSSGAVFEEFTGDFRGGKGEGDADFDRLPNGGAKVGCRFSKRDKPDALGDGAGVGFSASRGASVGVLVVRESDVDNDEPGSLTAGWLEVPL